MVPKKGNHHYKFFVDGEWRVDPNQPVDESSGYKNNVINLEEFMTYDMEEQLDEKRKQEEEEMKYKQAKQPPSYDAFAGEPPVLPPYLRQIILNKVSLQVFLLCSHLLMGFPHIWKPPITFQ